MRTILLIISLFVALCSAGQDYYFVAFKNKKGSGHSLANPSTFLSQKSLERRMKNKVQLRTEDLPLSRNYLQKLGSIAGVHIHSRHKWKNGVAIRVPVGTDISPILSSEGVKSIQRITSIGKKKRSHLNKFAFEENLPLRVDYGKAWAQVAMLSVDDLHKSGFTGKNTLIAVFDAGFRSVDTLALFKRLWDNKQIVGQWDFVDGDGNALHASNHGMNVLSTMACLEPSRIVGTAPDASYVLYRTEAGGSESRLEEYNWAAAAEYADSIGADIINSSLGYTVFDDPKENYSYADMDGKTAICTQAAEKAASKGILVVNSAGNSGSGKWFYVGAPADGENVFSIGAVNSNQTFAPFSSRGPNYLGVRKPNVCAQGALTALAATTDSVGVTFSNGTSFSSPLIAGACASLMQALPNANTKNIKKAIEESAHLYKTANDSMGYGIPNFQRALDILINKNYDLNSSDYWTTAIVSPNPAVHFIHIEFVTPSTEDVNIVLIDIAGNEVYRSQIQAFEGYNEYKINIHNYKGGIYVLKLSRANSVLIKKVMISRNG